jgi:2,5-diketo-D-gluconate reductase A
MAEHPPVMNQIEVHPFLTQDQVIAYNTQHSILTQAWSPLARGQVLDNPLISKIAGEHGKSNSQIVLRWHIQRGTAVIPKSTSRDRIIENLNVFDFELSEAQMLEISSLNRNYRTGVDPEDRN